jgi:iron-sulfur cluster insertion protein
MSANPPIPVLFSEDAVTKVRELMAEEGNPNLLLRVSVSGGGCSGLQYGFAFEERSEIEDLVIEKSGVRVLVDPISLQYLSGAQIDFQDGADGSRFVIKNPNAKSTCGCGSSFSMADNGNTNGNTADGKGCASRTPVDR